jgi:hypothetical protein
MNQPTVRVSGCSGCGGCGPIGCVIFLFVFFFILQVLGAIFSMPFGGAEVIFFNLFGD